MNYFLIDYENTGENGLKGILELDENCCVVIFYSENADKLSFDMHQKLTRCRTKLDFRKINTGKKNALDFQLSTYLGFLIAQCDTDSFYIVSKDNGYRAVVDFWKEKKVRQIDYVGRTTAKPLLIEAKQAENGAEKAAPAMGEVSAEQPEGAAETAQENPQEQPRTDRPRRARHGRRRGQGGRAQEQRELSEGEARQLFDGPEAAAAEKPAEAVQAAEKLPFTDEPKTERVSAAPESPVIAETGQEPAAAAPVSTPAKAEPGSEKTEIQPEPVNEETKTGAAEKAPEASAEKTGKRGRRSPRSGKQRAGKQEAAAAEKPEAAAVSKETETGKKSAAAAQQENPVPEETPAPAKTAQEAVKEEPEKESQPEKALFAETAPEAEAKAGETDHRKKTHRGGRKKKEKAAPVDEFAPGEELKAQVAQLIDEPEAQEQIGRFIVKYKTKQGVNNAIVKLYGTEKAGELYKKIKPLLKDKKGK